MTMIMKATAPILHRNQTTILLLLLLLLLLQTITGGRQRQRYHIDVIGRIAVHRIIWWRSLDGKIGSAIIAATTESVIAAWSPVAWKLFTQLRGGKTLTTGLRWPLTVTKCWTLSGNVCQAALLCAQPITSRKTMPNRPTEHSARNGQRRTRNKRNATKSVHAVRVALVEKSMTKR